jgi:hypothetical protein
MHHGRRQKTPTVVIPLAQHTRSAPHHHPNRYVDNLLCVTYEWLCYTYQIVDIIAEFVVRCDSLTVMTLTNQ